MAAKPANTGGKQAGRFPPGTSGNPAGKPRGARHRSTVAVERLLDGEAEAIGRKCIELALGGDTTALRLSMERIAPVRRARVRFDLPAIVGAADLPAAGAALLQAVSDGVLAPEEAAQIGNIVGQHAKALEIAELERRIAALERGGSK